MPAEIVSLNQYRKAKLKAEKEGKSAVNRVRHGRSGAERRADDETPAKADTELSAKKLDRDPADDGSA